MVSQEPLLLNRSIRENIIYALDNGSDVNDEANNDFLTTEIIDAAKFANAHTFITELVDGYETQCGQRGGHLNGSQTQRVCISRAIIRKPTILLLDEATSSLDPVNERLLQDALFKNKKERKTIIISAHRLSTIEKCDKIFVIHKGHLIEQGTHNELMLSKNGIYQELVRREKLDLSEKEIE
ncbi:unnamed protein product [Didymodactylos carnosus]|uniref:ABC transporter domain-containing protein n=1 Tax=Didymodactylos carnosus TaxID=1234261 RepID=A0A8S2RKU5_9BILA|nr:unnamed protein product [Didymodactylos carnosus]CAF4172034.1 unnamed protein product [Didymodactylos carnosus]